MITIEPLPPITTDPGAAPHMPHVAGRARDARAWIARCLDIARKPGIGDPTAELAGTLGQAELAIREALDAYGELREVHHDLDLALEEVQGGIAMLTTAGATDREAAVRRARLADAVLERAIAAVDPEVTIVEPPAPR